MFGSAILEAAMGTVAIYILLSLVCLALNEWISRLLDLRPGILKKQIGRILGEPLASSLVKQPLIENTFESGRFPDYIPASTFALALMEIAYEYRAGTGGKPGETEIRKHWTGPSRLLLEALRLSATSMSPIQTRIEKWFDLSMEQASGKYKRIAKVSILALSAIMVGAGNVDTISIASHLYDGALVHAATRFTLFWTDPQPSWYLKVPGLFLTWAAVSLGAPFWFDILNKHVNLRQTGLPPDENKRQTPGALIASQ